MNEKIEWFFESCSRKGLTGRQGVIIPALNTKHLALRRAVVEAVESGRFAIYAVNTIDEAVELLTGTPAGERGLDGKYPPTRCLAGPPNGWRRWRRPWRNGLKAKRNPAGVSSRSHNLI